MKLVFKLILVVEYVSIHLLAAFEWKVTVITVI